jgi:hypothetical protein
MRVTERTFAILVVTFLGCKADAKLWKQASYQWQLLIADMTERALGRIGENDATA